MQVAATGAPRADSGIRVTILTGFLGSGKTTLLKRFLSSREARNVAVLVNEVAEIGIDQRLLDPLSDDVQLLENGCVCCSVRGDLHKSLAAILDRSPAGAITGVVIETTGLADPAPIIATFASDPKLRFHFRIGAIVATVDCTNASSPQLDRHREFTNQIAAADRVVLTKTDIAGEEAIALARFLVARLNPTASVVTAAISDSRLAGEVFENSDARSDEVSRLYRVIDASIPAKRIFAEDHPECGDNSRLRAIPFCIALDRSFDWSAFALWLTMLLHAHGDNVLRVKGILNVAGSSTPVLINGVHGLMHQPEHLPCWPDGDRRSIIVFIVAGMDPEAIRQSLGVLVT